MIVTTQITHEQEKAIQELIDYAEKNDSASPCIQLDSNLNYYKEMPCWFLEYSNETLIGVCSIFAINTFEAELSLLVHPEHRMKGIAKSLLTAATQAVDAFQFDQILFVCDGHSKDGLAFIAKRELALNHAEYTLKYDKNSQLTRASRLLVSKAYEKEFEKIVEINVDAFDDDYEVAKQFIESILKSPTRTAYLGKLNYHPICTLTLGHEDGRYTINGVAVLKAFQNQGIATEFIQEVIHSILDHPEDIFIDVDSNNSTAYKLYKKIGFKETRITNYYVQKRK